MQFGFEVVAGRRTAGWIEDIPDERWVYEDEGVGEAVVSAGMEYHPANGYQPDGTFEWEGFSYDSVRTPTRGKADSLEEAKRRAQEAVRGGQTSLASRKTASEDEMVLVAPDGTILGGPVEPFSPEYDALIARENAGEGRMKGLEWVDQDDPYFTGRTAAKPKRETGDEPVQVPMRPQQQIRQSLSADQKKVRRQMTRKTATTKESTMTARREADLLQAMAVASLDDQRRLAIELADLRRQRTATRQAERDLDLADTVVRAHLTPVATHTLHTAATDWVGEDLEVYSGDPTIEVKSAATLWFNKTSAAVREDAEEFALQAEGMALRTAGRYGEAFEAAHRTFMDHVAHLYGKTALTADPSGQGQSTITDYDTKTDQDPLFAEDFDGEKNTGSEIGSGVHPEPLNIAENKGTGGGTAGDDVDDDSTSMQTPDSSPHGPTASRRTAREGDPHGEDQERIDYLETRGDDPSEPDADTIRGMDDDEFERWMDRESKRRAARRKTAVSLTNVGIEGDHGVGTNPSGQRVKFRLSPKDKKALQDILHSDLAINFSGVDVEESDLIKDASRKTAGIPESEMAADEQRCPTCEGGGVTGDDICQRCYGSGVIDKPSGTTSARKTAGEEVRVLTIPDCDVHRFSLGQSGVPAKYDSRLPGLGGSWGNVCEDCFQAYGPGTVGTGNAQRLVQGSVREAEQRREVTENDPPVAVSDLEQVDVDNQVLPGETEATDDPNVPSGAADVLGHDPRQSSFNDSIEVVAAFRRRVQANLARQSR